MSRKIAYFRPKYVSRPGGRGSHAFLLFGCTSCGTFCAVPFFSLHIFTDLKEILIGQCLRSQEKQALKIVRFQRHLPLTIQFYISCRITGVPPLQSDFYGLSSALKDDTNEPKKRKEARTKPTKMARKKSTLRITTSTLLLHTLRTPTSNAL